MESEREHLQNIITENLALLGPRLKGRAPTVAVIGTVGVGKSSLINSISVAMSKSRWREYALTGHHGTRAEPVTGYTRRYPRCCRPEEISNPLTPTLLDIGGLPDQLDSTWEEVIRMVFYGRVPVNENLQDVYSYLSDESKLKVPKYEKTYENLKVDRVLVVASATEDIPENLLEMVVKAARPIQGPNKRAIPIFGVLTKIDHVDPDEDRDFRRREKKFKDILGLRGAGTRYSRIKNYCDDTDPDNSRIHSYSSFLDVPILRIMTQICDPAIEVVNPNQRYPSGAFSAFVVRAVLIAVIAIASFIHPLIAIAVGVLCLLLYYFGKV